MYSFRSDHFYFVPFITHQYFHRFIHSGEFTFIVMTRFPVLLPFRTFCIFFFIVPDYLLTFCLFPNLNLAIVFNLFRFPLSCKYFDKFSFASTFYILWHNLTFLSFHILLSYGFLPFLISIYWSYLFVGLCSPLLYICVLQSCTKASLLFLPILFLIRFLSPSLCGIAWGAYSWLESFSLRISALFLQLQWIFCLRFLYF